MTMTESEITCLKQNSTTLLNNQNGMELKNRIYINLSCQTHLQCVAHADLFISNFQNFPKLQVTEIKNNKVLFPVLEITFKL